MIRLDEFAPTPDIRERHSIEVAAKPDRVLAAACELTSREVPLLLVLMGLRGLPGLLHGRVAFRPDRPLLDEFTRLGFVELARSPDEIVFGATGRFWRLDGGLRRVPAADFCAFDQPGWAQTAVSFRVEDHGGRTLLSTETRITATDPTSRRRFGRYWRVIKLGSVAIRLAWLRAIKRRALRAAAP
jgi:hypothetical protein